MNINKKIPRVQRVVGKRVGDRITEVPIGTTLY
jgi:hypothetical protein